MTRARSVAIVGLGLIGGSIARRLSEAGWSVGWIDPAVEESAVVADLPEAEKIETGSLRDWSLIVLATPTGVAIDLIDQLDTRDAVVTSVCSVMQPLVARARKRSIRFVAGHPMAGREVRGWSNSLPALFLDRPWFRVADSSDQEASSRVDEMIVACDAVITPIDPVEHDRFAAVASHLPQLLSSALAALVEDSDVPEPFRGPGLRTFLRLAGSPWSMWEPVFDHNGPAVDDAKEALDQLVEQIRSGNGEAIFSRANRAFEKQ